MQSLYFLSLPMSSLIPSLMKKINSREGQKTSTTQKALSREIKTRKKAERYKRSWDRQEKGWEEAEEKRVKREKEGREKKRMKRAGDGSREKTCVAVCVFVLQYMCEGWTSLLHFTLCRSGCISAQRHTRSSVLFPPVIHKHTHSSTTSAQTCMLINQEGKHTVLFSKPLFGTSLTNMCQRWKS